MADFTTPHYIGKKISLISTSDVRYEGTLHTIDPQESTIALRNVKYMGTEDRKSDQKIEASPVVYEFIVFKGENIKNLSIIEPEPNSVLNDPAILQVKEYQQSASPQRQPGSWEGNGATGNWNIGRGGAVSGNYFRSGGGSRSRGRGDGWMGRGGRGGGFNQGYNNNNGYPNHWRGSSSGYQQSGFSHNPMRKNRRKGGNTESKRNVDKNAENETPGTGKFLDQKVNDLDDAELITDKEFDFEGNLARFDMSNLKDALPGDGQNDPREPTTESRTVESESKEEDTAKKETECAYDKDNFFDSLSTDKDIYKRQTGNEMSELNEETFGKIGSTYQCRTRWFRRWRGNYNNRGVFRGSYNQRKFN